MSKIIHEESANKILESINNEILIGKGLDRVRSSHSKEAY